MSGWSARICARKASPRGRSGSSTTGTPASVATSLTADGRGFRPRPAGRSGCVTTPTISCPSSSSARRLGAAKSGVPQKRIFTGVGSAPAGSSLRLRLRLGLLPLRHLHLALEGAQAVDEEDAVQVIDLVLEGAREQPLRLQHDRLP